mgnify:CR=1 FL=1
MKKYNIEKDMRYLQLLANTFPTIANASTVARTVVPHSS